MKGMLSKIEVIIAVIILSIFVMWAYSKCSETKIRLKDEAMTEAIEDSLAILNQTATDKTISEALQKKMAERLAAEASDSSYAEEVKPAANSNTSQEPVYSKLYITIDKLKVRSGPGLTSDVLGELPLFSEVYFLNEVTDSTFEINLGKEIADEPYVKIKTRRGTVGWVYGAGVNYYKKKRSGVLE